MTAHMRLAAVILGACAVFGMIAFLGLSPFIRVAENITYGSPAGTTLNSAKVAEQAITVATDTVYAIQNTDASDRTIIGADGFFTGGAGTSSPMNILCATSTVATGLNGNTNYIFQSNISGGNLFGTTTNGSNISFASSSPGLVSTTTTNLAGNWVNNYARVWKAGSFLVCKVATSGNSLNEFDAGMTGYIGFPYRGN